MKWFKIFSIIAFSLTLFGNIGCAKEEFKRVDQNIVVGDKVYTTTHTKIRDPWGGNADMTALYESEIEKERPRAKYYVVSEEEEEVDARPAKPCQHKYVEVKEPRQRLIMIRAQEQENCEHSRIRLVNTRVVGINNQGSIGWVNNALQGVVGDGLRAGGNIGGAALIRPSRIGGGGSASASASSSAAAAGGAASSE